MFYFSRFYPARAAQAARPSRARLWPGFTLIELLIVVAIIAILAAVGVPHLLEAQTRSKISRVRSDLRASAIALEAYRADLNAYPAYGNPIDVENGNFPGRYNLWYVPTRLTTPVAYLSSLATTVFPAAEDFHLVEPYRYFNRAEFFIRQPYDARQKWNNKLVIIFGAPLAKEWELFSYGPDRADDDGGLSYDPTNGTFSAGDIPLFGP